MTTLSKKKKKRYCYQYCDHLKEKELMRKEISKPLMKDISIDNNDDAYANTSINMSQDTDQLEKDLQISKKYIDVCLFCILLMIFKHV